MKKIGLWILISLGMLPCVMGQTASELYGPAAMMENTGLSELCYEDIMEKITRQERMEIYDVPFGYDWRAGQGNQSDKNLYYTAKAIYEKNPTSFNAVYNYGILTYWMATRPDGLIADQAQLDEASKLFEQAKQIDPTIPGVYRHKILLLEQTVLLTANKRGYFDWNETTINVLRDEQNHWIARRLLTNIISLCKLRGVVDEAGNINQNAELEPRLLFDVLSAFRLCRILNRTEEAAAWSALALKWGRQYNASEDAALRRETVQQNKRIKAWREEQERKNIEEFLKNLNY